MAQRLIPLGCESGSLVGADARAHPPNGVEGARAPIARAATLAHPQVKRRWENAGIRQAQTIGAQVELDRLIERIYDAGVVDDAWREVMPEIVRYCGARSAVVLINDDHSGRLSFTDEVGLAADYRGTYLEDLRRDDLRLTDLIRHPIGTVRTDTMIPRYSAYRRSRAYRQLYRKLGTEHALGAFLHRDGDRTIGLRVFRPSADGPFEAEAIERYERLLPHLARSLRLRGLRQRPADAGAQARPGAQQALDLLPSPVFLIERVRILQPLNAAAQTFQSTAPAATLAALSELGSRAFAAWRDDGRETTLAALCARAGEGAPSCFVSMKVMPAPPDSRDAAPKLLALLSRPGRDETAAAAALGRLFGLTPAEQALAAGLASGSRLSEVAAQLFISYETARTHLRNIFAKTGVDRQSALVRLTLSLPNAGPAHSHAERVLPGGP